MEEVLHAVEKLRYFEQDLAQCPGKLTVGVAETLLCYKLPPLLKEFHRRAPQAQLMLCSMSCFDIRDELLRGSLDLGLFYQDVGGFGGNLTTYPVGTYPAALACAPGGEGVRWDFCTPQQQIPTPFVRTGPDCVFRQMFEGYLQAQSIQMEYNIELRSIPTIKNLVKNEVGVCFLPRLPWLRNWNGVSWWSSPRPWKTRCSLPSAPTTKTNGSALCSSSFWIWSPRRGRCNQEKAHPRRRPAPGMGFFERGLLNFHSGAIGDDLGGPLHHSGRGVADIHHGVSPQGVGFSHHPLGGQGPGLRSSFRCRPPARRPPGF